MKIETNKIIYTNNVFKTLNKLEVARTDFIITPLEKINNVLKMSTSNPLYKSLIENESVEKILNQVAVEDLCLFVNNLIGTEVLASKINYEKLLKLLFEVLEEITFSEENILAILKFLDSHLIKETKIYLIGFRAEFILNTSFKLINIALLTHELPRFLKWNHLEVLCFDTQDEIVEIFEKEKFLSWLELKSKTVITIKQLENFFKGDDSMHSFLIERALKNL